MVINYLELKAWRGSKRNKSNFISSNTDGSFTTANSNSFTKFFR